MFILHITYLDKGTIKERYHKEEIATKELAVIEAIQQVKEGDVAVIKDTTTTQLYHLTTRFNKEVKKRDETEVSAETDSGID